MFSHGDYNEKIKEVIDAAFAKMQAVNSIMELHGIEYDLKDRRQRMEWVKAVIDLFIQQTGKRPPGVQMDRLATFILREELNDKNTGKHKKNEHTFLSEQQMMRRQRKTVSMIAAESVATDGQNHRAPTRRKLMVKEMLHIDETTKIKNKDRRKKYAEALRPGEVIIYKIKSRRE